MSNIKGALSQVVKNNENNKKVNNERGDSWDVTTIWINLDSLGTCLQ